MLIRKKTTKKIGSIYASAIAIGLKPEKAKALSRFTSASSLRSHWDYRALGLDFTQARKALAQASSLQSRHYGKELSLHPYRFSPRVLIHIAHKEKRQRERQINLSLLQTLPEARSLAEIQNRTNGFGHGYGCVILLSGFFLVLKRLESTTWNKNKNWKWPESRSTDYSITLISEQGETLGTTEVKNRKGDWLERVGTALNLMTATRTAITQTASMVPFDKYKEKGFEITELRLFGLGFRAYCASEDDNHYHAATPREAIVGLERKMKARKQNLLADSDLVTLGKAKKMGFCQIGIREFLAEIGWQGCKAATAGEIRAAIQNIDVSPWRTELISLGILPRIAKENHI